MTPTNPSTAPPDAALDPPVSTFPAEALLRARVLGPPARPGLLASLDRFEVLELVGAGGMGIVLLARNPVTGTPVAIKVLRPELAREPRAAHRFLVEARHMYNLAHPHIMRVLEVSDRPEGPYYVMPYLERGSLARVLRPGEPAEAALTVRVAQQVAAALEHAHRRGIIHRDLKPANVLLDDEGNAYLADFGLVRTVFNDSVVDVARSQCEGTAPYMSPAVAAGEAEDTRCDIYSFGAMLYELLSGEPPYQGRTTQEILKQVLAGAPTPILRRNPKAPPGLAAVAEGAMARELRDRYAKMADVAADLARLERGQPPLGPRGRARHRPVRPAVVIGALAAALIAAVGIALVSGRFSPPRHAGPATPGASSPAPSSPAPATPAQLKTLLLDVLANLRTVDAWLELLAHEFAPDDFDARANAVRNAVAPGTARAASAAFDWNMAEARVASLRRARNGLPLNVTYDPAALAGLAAGGSEPQHVQFFYEQMGEVQDAGDRLLRMLSDLAAALAPGQPLPDDELAFHRLSLDAALESLRLRGGAAHLAGLRLLGKLQPYAPAGSDEALAGFTQLDPKGLITEEQYAAAMDRLLTARQQLAERQAELGEQNKAFRDRDLRKLAAVNEQLKVRASDQWFEVVGKARTLRGLGRTTEAVGAFSRYADLFGASDPTAGPYSRAAVQFTLQLADLGVEGGIYLYELSPGGPADKAGMAVGDILISYAGRSTPDNEHFIPALKDAAQGDPVRIEYLRPDAAGKFTRRSATLPGGSMGAGFMPI